MTNIDNSVHAEITEVQGEPSICRSQFPQRAGTLPGLDNYQNSDIFVPNKGGNSCQIKVAPNIAELGLFHAASMIAALQYWQKQLPIGSDANLVLATGKTQLIGIAETARLMRNWHNLSAHDREVLKSCGADLSLTAAFDPNRVKIFHLDTILPQRRDALHSYANQVNKFADLFGVPKEKRFLFYGDLKLGKDEPDPVYGSSWLNPEKNRMSPHEFKLLQNSVKYEGIRIADHKKGEIARTHIQHKFLSDVDSYGKKYAEFLKSHGGPHVINFSTGAGYNGEGHIGFTEANDAKNAGKLWRKMKAFCGYASHAALAGNIKCNGGMHQAFTPDGKPKVGIFTLSMADFLSNTEASGVLIINTSAKSSSVEAFSEHSQSPEKPVTALQGIGSLTAGGSSKLIVDLTSFRDTLYARFPAFFTPFVDFNSSTIAKFYIEAVKLYNKYFDTPITLSGFTQVKLYDVCNKLGKDAGMRGVNLTSNLISLEKLDDPNLGARRIALEIRNAIRGWSELASSLGLTGNDKVFNVSPHLDDVPLALANGINALSKAGMDQKVLTATPGDSAVSDTYALSVIDALQKIPDREIGSLNRALKDLSATKAYEKKLLKQLVKILENPNAPVNTNTHDYNFWQKLSDEEQQLRAKLVYLRINSSERWSTRFASKDKFAAVTQVLGVYSSQTEEWNSPKQPRLLRDIKTAIRMAEDQTAFMARGVPYEGISNPIESRWYTGGVDRDTTICAADINDIRLKILAEKPKLIVLNGEGFMDHEAHCLTEMTFRLALRDLIMEGKLDWGCKVLLYRGVWDCAPITGEDNQIIIALDDDDMSDMDRGFPLHYRSQAPALVPDGGYPDSFFSDSVIKNAKATRRSLCELIGETAIPEKYRNCQGFLAFNTIDLSVNAIESRNRFLAETNKQHEELEFVKEVIERSCHSRIVGRPTYNNLSLKRSQIQQILTASGLNFDQLFVDDELNGCSLLDL